MCGVTLFPHWVSSGDLMCFDCVGLGILQVLLLFGVVLGILGFTDFAGIWALSHCILGGFVLLLVSVTLCLGVCFFFCLVRACCFVCLFAWVGCAAHGWVD